MWTTVDAHAVALRRLLAEADGASLEPAPRPVEPEVAEQRRARRGRTTETGMKPIRVWRKSVKSSLIRPPGDGRR